MAESAPNVPAHLLRFVVEQDYSQYNAADQAVWRFVLQQTHTRLVETAHPAYRDGLAASGIAIDRIPSIPEMNEKLGRFGWGAVAVDGFIPPRAFQEFQAAGILPIAADIRTRDHLVYTPAPDIIHEAAGHAPILPDPAYASYLRRIGEVGRRAFTLPDEQRVYQAIFALSEIKEDPARSAEGVRRAEEELEAAVAAVPEPSEATRLARLYWWTAEYGLVGTPERYQLYGAGLLSSLGESHSCHAPEVRKLPLDEACVEVGYDVTRRQPQLFVARDFERLHDVLNRVAATLAERRGGALALERALASAELCTLRCSSGASLIGTLAEVGPRTVDPVWLRFEGDVAVAWDGRIPDDAEPSSDVELVIVGDLRGGGAIERTSDEELGRRRDASGKHRFVFANGAVVEGTLERVLRHRDGRLRGLSFGASRVVLPERPPLELASFQLVAAGNVVTAHAGAADPRFHGHTAPSPVRVPKPRRFSARQRRLISLQEGVESARSEHEIEPLLSRVHEVLERDYPDEWLLRFDMLEALLRARQSGPLSRAVHAELELLEERFERRQPIASGLRYLTRFAV